MFIVIHTTSNQTVYLQSIREIYKLLQKFKKALVYFNVVKRFFLLNL